jgi:hypothetical protein
MSTQELATKPIKPSKLEQFNLGFELNETWNDARKKYITGKS